jgi:GntR family transcriptional regulator / MocR family aminotransferase
MRIPLNRELNTPLYRQISQFLETQIKTGNLATDVRLPASRELAASLGVGRLTVNTAYAELESKGLIYSLPGNGTFVCALPPGLEGKSCAISHEHWPEWQQRLNGTGLTAAAYCQEELISSATHPDLISFAEGRGDYRLFPQDDFRKAIQLVLKQNGNEALSYGETAGYFPLRQTIARILTSQGIPVFSDQILITSGSQQALGLVTQTLVHPGEVVLVESPTHMGFIDLCHTLELQILEIPVDEQGMQMEKVEENLAGGKVKMIYTVPNFQNPTGSCLSTVRRRQLVNMAETYQIPILEDDFVGDLRYKGLAQPALKALDGSGTVIYASTFSKMLIPSLRIGYLAATGPVFQRLMAAKHTSDVCTSALMQRALDAYINVGRYQACLRRARQIYGHRRAVMLTALNRWMPAGVRWNKPQGGLFIWLSLPEGTSADEFFSLAAEQGVIFTPGSLFYPQRQPQNCLRLNFSLHPPDRIEEGVRRLGMALKGYLSTSR